MNKKTVRIGTRASELALIQTNMVIREFEKTYPGYKCDLIKMTTKGDEIKDTRFSNEFYKGFFTRELEAALLNNEIDAAVHSLKDLPSDTDDRLTLSCYLRRASTADCLIVKSGQDPLVKGAKVGTSSLRRKYFLSLSRPDLSILPIKGNIATRIRKLMGGEFDSVCLAKAGLERLNPNLDGLQIIDLSRDVLPPSPCQGIIAVQTRMNHEFANLFSKISHQSTSIMAGIERAFLKSIGAGCNYPLAAIAEINGTKIDFSYWLANQQNPIHDQVSGNFDTVMTEVANIGKRYKQLVESWT
ncbi:MAG: hydroxymethylbilane synthase [Planctomycetes bacterium]|nr:hydroxymethylbilane synthase [Planctomycetota bacterium]